MSSSSSLLLLILPTIIFGLLAPTTADDVDNGVCTTTADYCWSCSGSKFTNATQNSTTTPTNYLQNLNTLLSSLSSNTQITNTTLYNSSLGAGTNKVNVLALCRGDVTQKDCFTCFNDSNFILLQNCSTQIQAVIWAQKCTIRYSNVSLFGIDQDEPVKFVPSPNTVPNAQEFKQVLNPLMVNLAEKAASGDSMKKFAAGHALVPTTNKTIYAIAQCSPDLDKQNCSDCLEEAIEDVPKCCEGKDGGRVLKPSCNLRFENNIFYDPAVDSPVNSTYPPATSPATSPAGSKGNDTSNIATKVSTSSFFQLLLFSLCLASALALF